MNEEILLEFCCVGGDVALPLAAGWLSLAVDSSLRRAIRRQHVALSVFGLVMIAGQDPAFNSEDFKLKTADLAITLSAARGSACVSMRI
ncbi:MAG TPA: hypothetical protein VFY60_10170 [Pyrinomonadaceae bacterium]|nr:hypothetical protein [Pyrinomonadaceae bacterium]